MKSFYCIVPYQRDSLPPRHYTPVGNQALDLKEVNISFPILTAVAAYVSPGEDFRIVAVHRPTEQGKKNMELFKGQLAAVCQAKGLKEPSFDLVEAEGESAVDQAHTFHRWNALAQDNDQLYACMTRGSKPQIAMLLLTLQYACRIKENTRIACVVYGEVNWAGSKNAVVHDMTLLIQMDELVRRLADRKVADPWGAISAVLGLEDGHEQG